MIHAEIKFRTTIFCNQQKKTCVVCTAQFATLNAIFTSFYLNYFCTALHIYTRIYYYIVYVQDELCQCNWLHLYQVKPRLLFVLHLRQDLRPYNMYHKVVTPNIIYYTCAT